MPAKTKFNWDGVYREVCFEQELSNMIANKTYLVYPSPQVTLSEKEGFAKTKVKHDTRVENAKTGKFVDLEFKYQGDLGNAIERCCKFLPSGGLAQDYVKETGTKAIFTVITGPILNDNSRCKGALNNVRRAFGEHRENFLHEVKGKDSMKNLVIKVKSFID